MLSASRAGRLRAAVGALAFVAFVTAGAACRRRQSALPPPGSTAPLAASSAPTTVDAGSTALAPLADGAGGAAPVAPSSSAPPFDHRRIALAKRAMGTHIDLAAYTTPEFDAKRIESALQAAFDEIVRLERLMTTWRDDSELSAVNRAAGKSAVVVSPETYAVIDKSLWISRASEGVFDITFASMGKLWKFDQDREARVPDAKLLEAARRRIDYRRIELDPAAHSVKLTSPETQVNLGGIAKGYAVDRAADVLRRAGLRSFFVQAGGDLYVAGRKPWGEPWRVGVSDPRAADGSAFATLLVEDHAFSTAGDYERAFILDGKRYHHIIDPRTGYPATASRSVTIWAPDAFTADAVDDAVFILGPEKGLALVESIEGCGAVIVDAHNQVHVSARLKGLLAIERDPTDGI